MATPEDLFNQYLNVDYAGNQKRTSLASASESKKQGLSDKQAYAVGAGIVTGSGNQAVPTQEEADLLSMPPADILLKYGPEKGTALLASRNEGVNRYIADTNVQRDTGEILGDSALSVISGFGQAVGGPVAFGLGLVDEDLGTAAAGQVDRFSQYINENKTDSINRASEAFAQRSELNERDTEAQYDDAIDRGVSPTAAGIARFGQDFLNAVGDVATDPALAGDFAAQGVGSLAAIPLLAAGAAAATPAAVAGSGARVAAQVLGANRNAVKVGRALEKAAAPTLAIGAVEAGGTYQQTVNEVINTPFETLRQTSPEFNRLVASGMSDSEARTQIANKAGTQAGLTQLPSAILAGSLVSKFEAAPAAARSARGALQNIGKETLEESAQSATSQLATNQAIADQVDPNKDVLAGVGTQAGVGAVAGTGTAGVVQVPGVIKQTAVDTATVTMSAVNKQVDALRKKNEADSTVSDERVAEAAASVQAAAPTVQEAVQNDTTLSDEEKQSLDALVTDATNFFVNLDGDAVSQQPDLDPIIQNAAKGQTTQIGLMQNLAKVANDETLPDRDRMFALVSLREMSQTMENALEPGDSELLATLPEEHPVRQYMAAMSKLNSALGSSPELTKANAAAEALAQKAVENAPLTAETAPVHVMAAEIAPQTTTKEGVDTILRMADQGKVQITPAQRSNLLMLSELHQNAKDYDEAVSELGDTPESIVSTAIKTGTTGIDGELSAMQHAAGIRQALLIGDKETARMKLEDLGLFAQHMQNKVGAINTHINQPDPSFTNAPSYQKLVGTLGNREFVDSGRSKSGVTPTSASSVRHAQLVAAEADFVTKTYNTLAETFSELGLAPMEFVELDTQLKGNFEQIAQGFADKKAAEPAKPKAEPKAKPAPVASTQPAQPAQTGSQVTTEPAPVDEAYKAVVAKSVSRLSDARLDELIARTTDELMNEDNPRKVYALNAMMDEAESRAVDRIPVEEVAPVAEPVAPAPEPVAEAAPVEEIAPEAIQEVSAPEPEDDTFEVSPMQSRYPTLASGRLYSSFNLPMDPISNLDGSRTPINDVVRGLEATIEDRTTVQSFKYVLGQFPSVLQYLNDNLNDFLNKKIGGVTFRDGYLNGTLDPTEYPNGRSFAIAEPDGNGFKLNTELVGKAYLAGVNWLLNGMSFVAPYDVERAAKVLGIEEEQVTQEQMDLLSNGVTRLQAIDALANNIQRYWGFTSNPNVVDGFTKGIPQAMAANIIDTMLKMTFDTKDGEKPVLVQTKVDIGVDGQFKEMDIFTPLTFAGTPLSNFRQAIEKLVAAKPEQVVYMGKDLPPVATTQMNNRYVKNTPAQMEMLKNQNATGYTLNPQTWGAYNAMGIDAIVELFGEGVLDPATTNKNDLVSRQGRNQNIVSAWDTANETVFSMEAQADEDGIPLDQVKVHYGHNVTSVGRAQQLGRYTPQSSKLMRTLLLPTNSKVMNLTDTTGQDYRAFNLAMGQLLGVKVHNFDPVVTEQELAKKITKYMPVIEVLQDHLANEGRPFSITELNLFKSVLGKPTFETFQGLVEYARFLNTEDKSQYTTQLYLEADGMSNGPFNSMALFSMSKFTADQLENLAKCGLYIGGAPETQNSWAQRGATPEGTPIDLYEVVSTRTKKAVANLRDRVSSQATGSNDAGLRKSGEAWLAQQGSLNQLMAMLIPDMVTLNDDGTIDTSRGISKNPTTITTYGSGKAGIGDKLTNAMLENLYSMISAALKARAADPSISPAQAMFPNAADADAKLVMLDHAMKQLTSSVARTGERGAYVQDIPGAKPAQIDISTEFTLSRDSFLVLTQNVRNMFVEPMHSAIQNTIGRSVAQSTDTLRKATQIQSIILGAAYAKRVREVLPKKGEEGYVLGGFLSQKQQAEIFQSLAPLNGMIQTGQQNYFIANSEKVGLAGQTAYGASFQDNIRTPATVYAPSDAGVKGIATMVIGSGDGMTIQYVSQDPEQTERAVFIFDGINYPLDFIQQGSLAANKAAFNAIMGNPMREVANSYKAFVDAFSDNKKDWVEVDDTLKAQLAKALYGPQTSAEQIQELTMEQVYEAMNNLAGITRVQADRIQARHNVLSRVNLGMDQMAAAGSPYLVTDKIQLTGTKDEIAAQLNELFEEELLKIASASREEFLEEQEASRSEDISGVLAEFPVDKFGVRVITSDALQGLADSLYRAVPRNQAGVIIKAVKNAVTAGFIIRAGTEDQLAQYNASLGANGVNPVDLVDSNGVTYWGTKEIWLLRPSADTLAHELIHASTFASVLGHTYAKYEGEKKVVPSEVASSIDAIEELMNQFLVEGDRISGPDFEGYGSYRVAHDAIVEALDDTSMSPGERHAVAINEYMAWGLANKNLAKGQANVPVTLSKIIWDTIEKIRNWLFPNSGKKVDDMLSNLVFHTNVVMGNSQPSLSDMVSDVSPLQARVYGSSERLADLDRAFNKKISDYATDTYKTTEVNKSAINADFVAGQFTTYGFPMTAQELNVFKKMVTAMGTHADLDPNVMNRMQELYSAATKELSPESFLVQPVNPTPADEAQARDKYDVIMGRKGFGRDAMSRTTLLPSFMALATVNDTMRDVLSKIAVPRTLASDQERAFDALLENQANKFLDGLSDVLTGDRHSNSITQSIDNLNRQLVQTAQDSQGFYDQYVSPVGSHVDRANALVVEGMNRLSNKFVSIAESRRQAGKDQTLIQQAANNGLEFAASIINEERAGLVGEAILAGANSTDRLPKWIHDVIADLVGRVDSNAALYDMIKKVRSSVQRLRNQFRTELPKTLAKQFTRVLSKEEWSAMHTAIGKTDLAALVQNNHFTQQQVLDMLNDQPSLNRAIRRMEDQIKGADAKYGSVYLSKADQLATFMMTGVPGQNLQRNALAIAHRLGSASTNVSARPDLERAIDTLVSLYALNMVPASERGLISTLSLNETKGVAFAFGYAGSLRTSELARLGNTQNGQGYLNHYKGHMPSLQQDGVSLIIADDAQHGKLLERSYTRKSAYAASSLDTTSPIMSYFFAPVSGRAMFNQGILQNVRQTVSGVDSITGYTVGAITAGRITEQRHVKRIAAALASGKITETGSNLMPVFNSKGTVIAYERAADPAMLTVLNGNTNLGDVFGAWKGRLAEEELAIQMNNVSIEQMADMYQRDLTNDPFNKAQYVNLFSSEVQKKNPVILDALQLFTPSTVDAIHAQFPNGEFWVRKDMLDNVIGYRSATIGDAWTGNTYWSKETQETVRKLALTIIGNSAYAKLVNAEQTLQGIVQDARTLIVVKSIVVPFANIMSNMMQLIARGVPLRSIVVGMPKKLAETRQYVASEKRAIEAEAEMFAATDRNQKRRLAVEVKAIRDSYKRMSIWPLIERGELSSMSDDAQPEDGDLTSGRLNSFIEAQVNKLPPKVRAAGKYALITKDTALYKGLRKSVEYGDFLAKAILWDDLVKRQGRDVEYAAGRITEEFVNFDRLGGRNRQYLENMGILWFYNFKIRSAKVGLSMIRNNPLHALMAGLTPVPGSIGSPITDNVFAQMVEGNLGNSIGLDQLLSAPMLHPLDNMLF